MRGDGQQEVMESKRRPGLNPTNKKVRKISGFLTKFSDFGYCDPTKNSWILFLEFWPASCTKKLDPIFFRFIQKNLRVQNFQIYPEKNWIVEFLLVGLSPGF